MTILGGLKRIVRMFQVSISGRFLWDFFQGKLPWEYTLWLWQNYGLARRRPLLSFCLTTKCNLFCKECIQMPLLKAHPGYEMSLEELRDFIVASEKSHYAFDFQISGGEPLLWPHLKEGLKMLRASKICHSITMFTNAMDISRFDTETATLIDDIRISKYSGNHGNIKILKEKYPERVNVVEREDFWPNLETLLPGVLPPRCCARQLWFFKRRIYFCAHCASIALRHHHDIEMSLPVRERFLDGLYALKIKQQQYVCGYCFHNWALREKIKKVKNVSSENS